MKTQIFKYLKLLLVSLFLVTRFAAVAHASEYGNSPHEHNEKICVLVIATDGDDTELALLPDDISLPVKSTKQFFSQPSDIKLLSASYVSACMRDPPSINQNQMSINI